MLITKKKFILTAVLITMLFCIGLVFTSCDINEHGLNANTIEDVNGRQVKYPKNVEKIATVGSATRMVVYAEAQDKLVAITEMDKPSELRPYTLVYPELFASLPTTNNGNHLNEIEIDKEKLIELAPDVIFSSRSAQENDKLQNDIHIPVVGVAGNPKILEDLAYKPFEIVSEVCGTEEVTYKKLGKLRALLNEVLSVREDNTTKLYRGAINYKGTKDLCGTYSNYYIYEALRCINVAKSQDIEGAYDTTLEQILQWDPDYIVMDCTNLDKVKAQKAANSEVFSKIRAIYNNNTYVCGPFNYNDINLEYAICEYFMTAKMIFPNQLAGLNLETKYAEIFTYLCGKNIYPEIIQRGIKFGKTQL